MQAPKVGVSLLYEDDLRLALLPLFEAGVVDALEVSIDLGFEDPVPAWADALFDFFASRDALYAHGVHYSPLSASFEDRQATWLTRLGHAMAARPHRHLSEHYGFMTVPGLARGAPLPLPPISAAVEVGRDRLRRLADAARVPVGLENLALAFSADDARRQGELIDRMLAPVDGFLLLDVHNLHCQIVNFGLDPSEHLARFPLERVREIHVSGGRMHATHAEPDRPFRRDTHDDDVPEPVFALLEEALARCPRVEVVILERLGRTLPTPEAGARLRADFGRVRSAVNASTEERPR